MVQVTSNTPYLTLRFKFKKLGKLQYISHLDLVRTMNKIIVRAKLPLWYSEGFNPKPKMIFAAPLSIGTESVCEFMDIRLTEHIEPEVAMARLNENMTDEMQVLDAYYPTTKLTDMVWLKYTMVIDTIGASEEIANEAQAALLDTTVMVDKKTKPGEPVKTVDIRPQIKSCECKYIDSRLMLTCVLSSDASSFLNPEYIIKALRNRCGVLSSSDLTSEAYTIMREEAYNSDMTLFN